MNNFNLIFNHIRFMGLWFSCPFDKNKLVSKINFRTGFDNPHTNRVYRQRPQCGINVNLFELIWLGCAVHITVQHFRSDF